MYKHPQFGYQWVFHVLNTVDDDKLMGGTVSANTRVEATQKALACYRGTKSIKVNVSGPYNYPQPILQF